eukprot:6041782-Pleurochrysis_carterae.AAC.1
MERGRILHSTLLGHFGGSVSVLNGTRLGSILRKGDQRAEITRRSTLLFLAAFAPLVPVICLQVVVVELERLGFVTEFFPLQLEAPPGDVECVTSRSKSACLFTCFCRPDPCSPHAFHIGWVSFVCDRGLHVNVPTCLRCRAV